jgi:transposase
MYECDSIIQAQKHFQHEVSKPSPEQHTTQKWMDQFEAAGTVLKEISNGRPRESNERINAVGWC